MVLFLSNRTLVSQPMHCFLKDAIKISSMINQSTLVDCTKITLDCAFLASYRFMLLAAMPSWFRLIESRIKNTEPNECEIRLTSGKVHTMNARNLWWRHEKSRPVHGYVDSLYPYRNFYFFPHQNFLSFHCS